MVVGDSELIEKHAPILWLHPDEAFLPEDCKVMAESGDLYKKGEKPRPVKKFKRTLDDLGNYGSNYFLKLPEIDMKNFMVPARYGIPGSGPEAVAELARKLYSNNPFSSTTVRHTLPKFYARIGRVSISPRMGVKMNQMAWMDREQQMRKFFGNYTIIQYFFFYVFNDFWNKHVGDWDSTIQILIKEDNPNEKYAIYSMHETNWFVKLGQSNNNLRTWLKRDWNSGQRVGTAYVLGSHPFGFVARGGHGVYPTPGYTSYGIQFPFRVMDSIALSTDERVIGYTGILPNDVDLDDIREPFEASKPPIDTSNLKILRWDSYEILKDQSWLKYKGLWGEDTNRKGWDGPEGPLRDRWRLDSANIRRRLRESFDGYEKDFIFDKWDGIP